MCDLAIRGHRHGTAATTVAWGRWAAGSILPVMRPSRRGRAEGRASPGRASVGFIAPPPSRGPRLEGGLDERPVALPRHRADGELVFGPGGEEPTRDGEDRRGARKVGPDLAPSLFLLDHHDVG